jgi:hypothetical protein
MAPAILSVIAFLALVAWRFVFTAAHRRLFARVIAPRHQRHTSLLAEGLRFLELGGAATTADPRLENREEDADRLNPKDRAKRYLQRVATLTGATQMDDTYILDIDNVQFQVRHRYVKRRRDTADPECTFEETCFYPVHKDMPKAEEIATALLQLKNNPALFDQWAAQNGAYRADGQPFRPT